MPWSIQTWIDGQVATPDGLASSTNFALEIANLITNLRSINVNGRSFDGVGRGGNLTQHDQWVHLCLERSERLLDVPRLRRLWVGLRLLPSAGPDVMSHKDLIPPNLLVRDDRLTGVLDTGGFGPADPALDLVAAWHHFDHQCRQLIRGQLACGNVEWQRGAAWAFVQAIGLVWHYQETNPTMAALGRSTLRRLLGDCELSPQDGAGQDSPHPKIRW